MTADAYSSVCSSPGMNCASYTRIERAASSMPTYAWNQSGRMSLYRCHQPGLFDCSARLSSCSRSRGSTPYSVSRSSTSISRIAFLPSSIRLILDSDARIFAAACRAVMPRDSRSRRRWEPSRMRRTVGPSEESGTTPTSSVYSMHATGTQLRRRGPTLRCQLMISHMRFQVGYPTLTLAPRAAGARASNGGLDAPPVLASASAVHARDLRIVHARPGLHRPGAGAGLPAR